MEAGGVHGNTSGGLVETAMIETMRGRVGVKHQSGGKAMQANVSQPVRGSRGANWTGGSLWSSCFLRRD